MIKGLVSVIIPTKNRLSLLKKSIESVVNQTYKKIEIIIVDDGSTDGTREYLKQTNSLIYLSNSSSVGASASRNTGISHAKGEYIAFLDDDDEWMSEKIAKQIPLFSNPKVGLVYTGMKLNYTDLNISYQSIPTIKGFIFDKILIENKIGGTVSVVLRSVIVKEELFDLSFPAREEYDLWLRVCRNWEIDGVSEALVNVNVRNIGRISSNIEHYENGIALLNEKYQNDIEDLSFQKRKERIAEQYFFLGSQAVKVNNISIARKYFIKSIIKKPMFKAFAAFLSTFLGLATVLRLRQFKRK